MLADRLASQLLSGPPARDAPTVARHLLAVQGQDGRGARLAVRARTHGLSAADVDAALTEQRSLLITWLCRGTLHLVASEDYAWLHALTTPQLFTGCHRRLAEEGVAPDAARRAVKEIERSIANEGPLTRAQLGERIAAARVPTAGQALIHLLFLASIQGTVIRGPMVGAQHAYVLVRDWLGPASRPSDRDRSLAELARRYLRGHAPASDRDLARWAGLPLRDARAGLEAIAPELVHREDGLLALADTPAAAAIPPPRLLGAFDPLLVGWGAREFVNGDHDGLVTSNGLFRPFALAGGRAVATWRIERGSVQLEPFGELADADRAALEADAVEVNRYLGF